MYARRAGLVAVWALVAALLGAGRADGAADVETITHGATVRLEDHLVPGRLVLFDFYADWCSGCRLLAPRLEALAARYPEQLALRKVDIVSWDSPVAQQHRMRSIPYLVLYGPNGELLARGGAGPVLAELESRLGGKLPGATTTGPARSPPLWPLLVVGVLVVGVLWWRIASGSGIAARGDRGGGELDGEVGARVWMVMVDGCVEGPFTVEQLDGLRRRSVAGDAARVRRTGETRWRTLGEVLAEADLEA